MNNKAIILALLILIVLVGGYFIFAGKKQQPSLPSSETINPPSTVPPSTPEEPSSDKPSPQPSGSQDTSVPQAKENVITYTDSGYSPKTLTVKSGETVTFKNESSSSMWPASAVHPSHRVYSGTSLSEHCPDINGTAFDACKGYLPGQTWSFKFDKVGSWKYHDHLNPTHTGTIEVIK
jgi:plastocyanin